MGTDPHRNRRAIFPLAAGIAALLFASLAHADVFRCEENGRVSYSERPCVGRSATLTISTVTAAAIPSPATTPATASGIGERIAVGMSSLAVLRAEGMPAEKTREKNSQGEREVWTYCRDDVYVDIHLQNSVVTKISRRAASARGDSASAIGLSASMRTVPEMPASTTPVESRKNPDRGATHAGSR